jgi:glycosyltransferase involved in cell wall biosynthesis
MNKSGVIYSASARSFTSNRPIQKMLGVIMGIRKAGVNVIFIGGGDVYPRKYYSASMGGNSVGHSLKNRGWLKESISEFIDILHDIIYFFYLLPIFIKKPNAILLERSSRLHISPIILAKLFRRQILLEWKDHLVDYDASLFLKWALFIEDLKIKFSDHVIVESKILQSILQINYPATSFYVAFNAVELEEFDEKSLLKSSEKKIDFLYAGGYADYHNMLCLVDAVHILTQKKVSIKLVCVGNGPHRLEMEEKVASYGLSQYFDFVESKPYSELTQIYKQASFGVLPGCTDIICPIKVMEYMGFGLVPIIPDYGCNREILNGDSAFYFHPNNPESFSEVLSRCLDFLNTSKDYIDSISLMNFQTAKDRLNWVSTWGAFVASNANEYARKK